MKPKNGAKSGSAKPGTSTPATKTVRGTVVWPQPGEQKATAPKTHAQPPRQQPPAGAQGRSPAPGDLARSLERASPDGGVQVDAGPGVAYPLFPQLQPGTLDAIRVYRTTARNDGVQGSAWHRQALPWSPTLTTWDDIARICGGGRFVVQALAESRVVTTATRTFDGPARTPTASDVASIAPGLALAENGQTSYETPNGWISIPGLPGPTQAAFIAFQQMAFYARADANNALAAIGVITTQLAEKAMKPDPGLAVLEQIVEAQRGTIDRLYSELNTVRNESTRLKIENVSTGNEEQKLKSEAIRKALEIVDGAAGAIAKNLFLQATSQPAATPAAAAAPVSAERAIITAGTPTDLGAAIARRAMEATTGKP
jgi:hypothetical protein